MKKLVLIGVVAAGFLLIGAVGNTFNTQQSASNTTQDSITVEKTTAAPVKAIPTCDGTSVTIDCTLEGVSYKTYIYHPAVPEKSHTETVTTYQQKVTGYCTLCNDGTRSPSCSTGRGTCSYHDGVAEWNAPIVSNVPVYTTKNVIDTPAQEAYVEKVTRN